MAGQLFIVSGPSGVGKTSLLNTVLAERESWCASVSHTTRPARCGEQPGRDYYFVSVPEFAALRQRNVFLEHAEIFGHYYGTSRQMVVEQLAAGKDIVLEIDWQGAHQVMAQMPHHSLFILPPSITILQQRLESRAQDNSTVIARRMAQARVEMRHCRDFDEVLINDNFAHASQLLRQFLSGEAFTAEHQGWIQQRIDAMGL